MLLMFRQSLQTQVNFSSVFVNKEKVHGKLSSASSRGRVSKATYENRNFQSQHVSHKCADMTTKGLLIS